jgi:hypothetical protein
MEPSGHFNPPPPVSFVIAINRSRGIQVCKKIPQVNNPTKVEPVSNDGRK